MCSDSALIFRANSHLIFFQKRIIFVSLTPFSGLLLALRLRVHHMLIVLSFSAGTGPRCALTVSKSTETRFSKSSWYEIWAATVEIYTMCIQRGTPGSIHGLGEC